MSNFDWGNAFLTIGALIGFCLAGTYALLVFGALTGLYGEKYQKWAIKHMVVWLTIGVIVIFIVAGLNKDWKL